MKAIKNHKSLVDFKDEVSDTTYDAFKKGFKECKKKISKVFAGFKRDLYE